MLARVASSTTAAACSTPRTGSPVAVAAATSCSAVSGIGDVAAHHHDVGCPSARIARSSPAPSAFGCEREIRTIRPQPAAAIFSARNRPRPPRPPVMM